MFKKDIKFKRTKVGCLPGDVHISYKIDMLEDPQTKQEKAYKKLIAEKSKKRFRKSGKNIEKEYNLD